VIERKRLIELLGNSSYFIHGGGIAILEKCIGTTMRATGTMLISGSFTGGGA
jgi:hypothetical protein